MEKAQEILLKNSQHGKTVHTIFESRGRPEDDSLELEYRRIADNASKWGYKGYDFKKLDWQMLFSSKKSNSSGLQLADLVARPIALNCLRPTQANIAYSKIKTHIKYQKFFP